MKNNFNPFLFDKAMREYQAIAKRHGEDSQQARDAFIKAFRLAPQHIKDETEKFAKEMGLLPKPTGYTDEGEPLFSVSDLSKHFGIDESQVMADIERLDPNHTRHYGNVNLIQ